VQKGLDSAVEFPIHEPAAISAATGALTASMTKVPFEKSVTEAISRDPRYHADAYAFLREALDYTIRTAQKSRGKETGHVSGPELCRGFRDFAMQQYGPMVPTILESWGIHTTRDIGEMVFNLIETGAFSQSESDSRTDFDNVFDFADAFVKPFLPARGVKPGGSPDRKKGR
jgi:uncharacterized repeat protein (TIGR04138 family)